MKLTDNDIRDIARYLALFPNILDEAKSGGIERAMNYISRDASENEWQSFRTKKDRSIDLKSAFHECLPGRRKIAVKVVDIFDNDTMKVIEVNI